MWYEKGCVGGYAKNSHKIPLSSWGWATIFVAGFVGVLYLGAFVGF